MKNKLFSIFTALAMVLGILVSPFTSAHAAPSDAKTTNTVTVHKILLKKSELDAHDVNKEYDGTQIKDLDNFFGATDAKEIAGVYFKLQKYTGTNDDEAQKDLNDDSKWEDVQGQAGLTEKEKDSDKVKGITFTTTGLKGKFRIVEDLTQSTYKGDKGEQLAKAKAVPSLLTLPLVNSDGIVKDAHVYPKNTQEMPKIDKNFEQGSDLEQAEDFEKADKGAEANVGADYNNYEKKKATVKAELGKEIPYEVKTQIPQDAKYKKLVWNDTMTKGLTFKKDSLVVEGAGLTADDYTLFQDDRGFKLTLKDSGLTKVERAAEKDNVEIKLTYKANVNSNAVVDEPEANDIKLDYGNKPGKKHEPKEVTPANKQIEVTKTWGANGDQKVTAEDKDVVIVYTLQKKNGENWENVESVTKKYKETKEGQPDQTAFNHTFTKLDDNSVYRVVERVSGYDAEDTVTENGKVTYKNVKDSDNPKPLNPTEPKVVNGGRKFIKTNNESKDSKKLERLAGAEFYIKDGTGKDAKYLVADKKDASKVTKAKEELDAKVKAYNKLSAEEQKGQEGKTAKAAIDTAQEAYNKAFKENATAYTWADAPADGEDDNRVVLTSDGQGRFEIQGLAYGTYYLEEKTEPKGYAKRSDKPEFKVSKGSYASNDQDLQYNKDNSDKGYGLQVTNKKVTIPQTGGIGSLIFVVAGLAIMAFAYTAYKKSQYQEA